MSLLIKKSLGIIACPGGRVFADKIMEELRKIFLDAESRVIGKISQTTNSLKEDVLKPEGNLSHLLEGFEFSDLSFDETMEIPVNFVKFANGEFKAEILETIRNKDIFIVQDVSNTYPVYVNNNEKVIMTINDHLMNLMTTVDACIQAKAHSVSVIVPSYPYSRQDKKHSREGLTASLFGRFLEELGVKHILTLDIHSKAIENVFRKTYFENLNASYEIFCALAELIDIKDSNLVVVSPDTGAVNRNKFFASSLKRPLALLYKERDYSKIAHNVNDSNISVTKLLGDVEGKNVFMSDDILATGGTFIKAVKLLKGMGAKKIICAISLPFFNGDAIRYFDKAYEEGYFYKIIGTNAVYHDDRLISKSWYYESNVAHLFAGAVLAIHNRVSFQKILDRSHDIQELIFKS
ncbi:phosphoribosylpyrophosphate synthetase [Borrelia miyamotoi]|uniref:ribose-phosphate diphosphokinase n=1 Tax=Borrelia miyamotoi FR64b TaxID=1292392 RepID=W5SIH2_9SPIR|nr:ribose-phosphate pyrophosphokinase [Borrelia miyamotoi]AHH04866.1 Ribose-phosphate pyrophosphokinase [Borrelia miyamotoi FR64b]AHH05605.1 Ribose-phosphate pyrophosphokinase [Borrelia miyamotoi FR64b]WAZ70359.1 ribose-phosphate pyrophosphokinase [Borrelia miyamotoi]BCR08945.1 phosphoribosylpyrophosphate synthetase [Borrelia miyamotoi]BCR09775.1 phosphoribosylpyrophosphate synthetase [Borrelia miyamotoi]